MATTVRGSEPAQGGSGGGSQCTPGGKNPLGAGSGPWRITLWPRVSSAPCESPCSKVTFIRRLAAGSTAAPSSPQRTSRRRRWPATANQRKNHHNPKGAARSKPSVRVWAAKAQATPAAKNNQGFNSKTARQPR